MLGSYLWNSLVYAQHTLEIGLFTGNVRPLWRHVECDDPELKKPPYRMQPTIEHCVRCRSKLGVMDIVQPVFQVTGVNIQNPSDPTDRGMCLGERNHYIHVDCKHPTLQSGGSLLAIP